MTKDDRDEDLASMAIKGLGITCRKDAIEMLRQMSKQENISVHLHEAVAESLTYCSNDSTH
jgi:predicted transcriptional regulator